MLSAPSTSGATTRQEDLFAAVWHLLKRLAEPSGCLLLVEDLHWADPDSLKLLSYMARETADINLWLVATYRTDELHRRHPLTATLAELSRERLYDEDRGVRVSYTSTRRLAHW